MMSQKRLSRPLKWAGFTAVLAAVAATMMVVGFPHGMRGGVTTPPRERYQIADVRRADIFPKRSAGGRVESTKKTVIECELERITMGIRGVPLSGGGASTLLSIIPDGSEVKKGDVLAVLDSSEYEELLLQQRITVERVLADYRQAELDLEVARLAALEYREGTMEDVRKEMLGKLALAQSDLDRSEIRVSWTKRMYTKGYVPKSQLTSDQYTHSVNLVNLAKQRTAHELFFRFQAPKVLRQLEGQVKMAETNLTHQKLRKKRMLERLALLEKQLDLCTIRAPHDGFVIYANMPERNIVIEAGMSVRQRQDLMYLPDLNEMEVVAMLHESIVEDVKKGMPADVRLEGMPGRRLEGHVVSVAPLPESSFFSDVRYFPGIIKLDHTFKGIRPGLTAHVDIRLDRRDQVIAVPAEAVVSEGGQDVCYVAHEDGLERREITLGQATQELLEVTNGLDEGEQVILNPPRDAAVLAAELRDAPESLADSAAVHEQEQDSVHEHHSATVAAVTDSHVDPVPEATH
jgi:HlyD family secretion protein